MEVKCITKEMKTETLLQRYMWLQNRCFLPLGFGLCGFSLLVASWFSSSCALAVSLFSFGSLVSCSPSSSFSVLSSAVTGTGAAVTPPEDGSFVSSANENYIRIEKKSYQLTSIDRDVGPSSFTLELLKDQATLGSSSLSHKLFSSSREN